jgi:hypothetical protein
MKFHGLGGAMQDLGDLRVDQTIDLPHERVGDQMY